MKLKVTTEAARWFIDEMGLEEGDRVQFFPKIYGGIPTFHENYFLGISYGKNGNIRLKDVVEGITFYFNEQDAWFLDDHDMEVIQTNDEVEYKFRER